MDSFKFGWRPDPPDHRDFLFLPTFEDLAKVPDTVDLRQYMPPVYNQGRIGSCTANAIGGAFQYERIKNGEKPDFMPSRLFIYWNERNMEGSVASDAGAIIRDGIKVVNKFGVCPEIEWPYDDTPAESGGVWSAGDKPRIQPPMPCYSDAAHYQVVRYQRVVQNMPQIRAALFQRNPIIFGISVYQSFFDDNGPRTIVPMPGRAESLVGGHAILMVGYDNKRSLVICRNSWGSQVQEGGYFYLPYDYVANRGLASDFWIIQTVES